MRRFLVVYTANGGSVSGNMFCDTNGHKLPSKKDLKECCDFQVSKNNLQEGTVIITGFFEVQPDEDEDA